MLNLFLIEKQIILFQFIIVEIFQNFFLAFGIENNFNKINHLKHQKTNENHFMVKKSFNGKV